MRFNVSLDVSVKVSNGSDAFFNGVTRNFSRSGLCFEAGVFGLALQEPLNLRVKMPDMDSFVDVSGDVAWKEQVDDKCCIGIAFREIDMEAKSHILDYAYDLWVEEQRNPESGRKG